MSTIRLNPAVAELLSRLVRLSLCLLAVVSLGACMAGQQKANKDAFDKTEELVKADPKHSLYFEKMVYEREAVRVYVKAGDSLPEDKGAVVIFVAQTMGDLLKADENNRLKQLIVYGHIEEEELWKIRYDMSDGKPYVEKNRLTTTM